MIRRPTLSDLALWAALPMAHTSRIEGRLKKILDQTRSRRALTCWMVGMALSLAFGFALIVATAYTPPRSLMAAITSGGFRPDTPAHLEANISCFQAAIRRFGDKDPWAGKAYYVLGSAQMRIGRADDALASFDKAIALLEPPYADSGIHSSARYERINTLDAAGRYAAAIAETQGLLKNGGRGLITPDLWENLRERLPEFKMMRDYADRQAQVKSFYAAFPTSADSRWTQTLPNGVTVQLVGCQQHTGNRHTAWTPDGRFLTMAAFERNASDSVPMTFSGKFPAGFVAKEQAKRAHGLGFALRLTYPPGMVVKAAYALAGTAEARSIETGTDGVMTENGVVVTDEREISRATGGVRLVAAHFLNTQRQVTLRVGVATGSPSALPPDAPDASYQWAEFAGLTLPPTN